MNRLFHIVVGTIIKTLYSSKKRNPKVWLFGEWFGQRCCDNCMYLANYIAVNHPEISLYWVSREKADLSALHKSVNHLVFDSKEAFAIYKIAGAVFMNQGFKDFSENGYNYFNGAITVNLWHGVMWKHIGHDGSKKIGRFFKLYTKLNDSVFGASNYIATSEDYANVCYSAFGANSDQIIRSGYPRNLVFYNSELLKNSRHHVVKQINNINPNICDDNTRIITYMPTFRDSVSNSFSFDELSSDLNFMSWLEEHNVIIVQKAHFITQQRHEDSNLYAQSRIVNLNDISAQILLAATDLLITDYSSCFFDFLLLDRPIIHFIYDYDFYVNQDRGVYYTKEQVCCGDIVMNKEDLPRCIIHNFENPMKEHQLRIDRKKTFMTYDNQDTCEVIFRSIQERFVNF